MNGSGIFVVRSVVADPADRAAFDEWYQTDHMPDALATFGARRGWRCWNLDDPSVHTAYYMFDDTNGLAAIEGSAGLKRLVADFDGRWGDRVARTREATRVVDMQATA
ncbi:MAG: hypothetical protein AAFR70_08885 [Pseudomonadota bacterium]